MRKKKKNTSRIFQVQNIRFFDKILFFIIALLLILGLAFLYSASSAYSLSVYGKEYVIFLKQLIWTFIGFGFMILISFYDLEKLKEKIPIIMGITLILLVITLLLPAHKGVKRWIPLGVMNLQTSEIAKIAVIMYLSYFIDKNYSKLNNKKILKKLAVVISLILVLIILQKDIGTPFLIFSIVLMVLFVVGLKIKYIFMPLIAGVILGVIEILRHPYRIERIKVFFDPWSDFAGKSFQTIQSFIAIGSGWWFGKGPGNSVMKLKYLPESHTDFIFPIIAEETGFIGVSIIVILFMLFFTRTILISKNSSSSFLSVLSFSAGVMITFQAFFNIAMSSGLIPTKGLPLPFFSYGGSSIITNLIMVGFILNTSMKRKRL